MTNPFARPDQPDSDETIPFVPEAGYPDQSSPWSSGYEPTSVDPLGDAARPAPGGYTNPVIPPPGSTGGPTPAPVPPTAPAPYRTPPAAAPAPSTSAPYAQAPYAPAPTYEQPPTSYGVAPYEPARERAPLAPVTAYSYGYNPPVEHPNSVPALVLGLLGFMVGVTFPIAWYLGAKGNADVKREPQRYRSSGMLTVGMVLGIFGTVMMALAAVGIVLLVVLAVAVGR